MNEINNRIKILRKDYLKLSQAEFGKNINFKQNSIALMESGKNSLTDRTISDICRQFRVSENWLRYGTGEIFLPLPTNEIDILCEKYNLSFVAKAILTSYIGLDENAKIQIDNFMLDVLDKIKTDI